MVSEEAALREMLQSRLKKMCRLLQDLVQPLPPHPATPGSSCEDSYLREAVQCGALGTYSRVSLPGPSLTGWLALSKLLHFSKPWFPHLQTDNICAHL